MKPKIVGKAFPTVMLLAAIFSLAGTGSCKKSPPKESAPPTPASPKNSMAKSADLTGFKEISDLQLQINPVAQTVSLNSTAGPDQTEIGGMTAALTAYGSYSSGYTFTGGKVYIFIQLKGTSLKYDVVSTRIQLSSLPAGVAPLDPPLAGTESKFGGHLIAGDEAGLAYYDYGDFYAAARAAVFNSGQPTSSLWCLAFDVSSLSATGTVSAKVLTRLPATDDSLARITIQPYLTNPTPTSVTVIWETDSESSSEVAYGPDASCGQTVGGNISRYQAPELSSRKAPEFNLFRHQAALTGLSPGQNYYYQVRGAQTPSSVYNFLTLSGSTVASFKFAVIGDTRSDDLGHLSLIKKISAQPGLAFYIHMGDYADNFQAGMRRNFFAIEQPLASRLPIWPVRGNHDEVVWHKEYFDLPLTGQSALDKRDYAFKYQNSYFIVLDQQLDLHSGSAAYNWLQARLAEAYADPARKFTFVFDHWPIYTGYGTDPNYNVTSYPLSALAPLFKQYEVSAGFGGHIHLYERLDVSGKPFFLCAAGGAPIYYQLPPDAAMLAKESTYSGETVTSQAQGWRYQYMIVQVNANSFTAEAYDNNGVKFDQVSYTK